MAKKTKTQSQFDKDMEKLFNTKSELESKLSRYYMLSNPQPDLINQLRLKIQEVEQELYVMSEQEASKSWNNEAFIIGEGEPKENEQETELDEKEQRRRARRRRRGFD